MVYLYLLIAICGEIVGTSALNATRGFTRLQPLIGVVVGYTVAFVFLSLVLRTMPVGVAYAIWSGVGIVLIAVVGCLFFGQRLDLPALIGMGLIIAGVLVVNLLSKTVSH
jgi:small multidrug resistance pump